MVGYYDLVSKVIVRFNLMDQLLTSQLLTSGEFSPQGQGGFVVFVRIHCVAGGGGKRIANFVMVIFLRTANIVLAACRLSHFDR
jgi:hypothetical protein